MRIGSGSTTKLLQSTSSKGFRQLISDFVSGNTEYPCALNSPIHALRAGAILEDVMYKFMLDDYLQQVRVVSGSYDVMTATLDFAKIDKGSVYKFTEMKSVNFEDFLVLNSEPDKIPFIKKKYKGYYNQVQQQLFVTDLQEATLMFIPVYDAKNDQENWNRVITDHEKLEVTITQDYQVQQLIEERAKFFQSLKEYLCQ